jgi:hypothetical protein
VSFRSARANLIPVNRIIYPQKTPEHAISEPTMLHEPEKQQNARNATQQ